MQNWEHLVTVFDKLMNKSPTQSNAFHYDFTKIRDYFVYGFGQYFRQTIILSRFASPDINGLLNYCYNVRGQVKIRTKFAQGIITSVHGSIPQIFERFDCDQPSRIDDARFEYFKTQVYPRMKQSSDGIFLILVSTYLDFVRIRNFFDEDHVPFFGVSEYSENARNVLSKHRAQGSTANYLLYTERHYYFHAPRLKDFKVNQIVFYTLPENDFVYRSFATRGVSLLQKFENCRVLSLFCKYDALKLERVVGTKRCQTLIHSETNTHLFDNN
jgi:U3 small nucleolar RNA-associated protein 25